MTGFLSHDLNYFSCIPGMIAIVDNKENEVHFVLYLILRVNEKLILSLS
jgi:deoxyxylulose-5-phosphate synthase